MNSKKVARVAVMVATYPIDKLYDYVIPEEMSDALEVGSRVLVSFGRGGRKTEAMVLALSDKTEFEKLKPIIRVLDETPILNNECIKMALWVREHCFCTFYDALKTMIPAGIWYRVETSYLLNKQADIEYVNGVTESIPNSKEIVDFIFKCSGKFTEEFLSEQFPNLKVKTVLDKLVEENIILIDNSIKRTTQDKTQRVASLCANEEEIEKYTSSRRISQGQKDVIQLLKMGESISVNELRYFTGASMSVFKTLQTHGIIKLASEQVYRRPKISNTLKREEITLNSEQNSVYSQLKEYIDKDEPSCSLINGVTGSGKTLIYIKLIEYAISKGKTALMLVPEIALTPQMVERFSNYFGDKIAILHSALASGERTDEYNRIKKGEVSVVVGTRSAVFAPLSNVGIVILDEEQEHSYKSGNTPRYHAREVAKFRCVYNNALLLLGSATPSVDSMYQAQSGKYILHTLKNRYNQQAMPEVIISDMRQALRAGNGGTIGEELKSELSKNIEKGEQSILFLNRRGSNRYAVCNECGEVLQCENCSVSLTYHSVNKRLMCHHCGYSMPATDKCKCGGELNFVGAGTQRVEEELQELFPGVKTIRMDTDTTFVKSAHQDILNTFRDEKVPILLGTQMITKGLDFENVTLVGVLNADQALYIDNYCAAEDTFSLITQVVGRAGRGDKKGRAVLQTMSPKNPIISLAAQQDYQGFYQEEISLREMRKLPPFRDLITIVVSGEDENSAMRGIMRILGKLKFASQNTYKDIQMDIFGPSSAKLSKINNRYRFRIEIGADFDKKMRMLISSLVKDFKLDKQNRALQITVDVNSCDL